MAPNQQIEQDFPPGHPGRHDFDPDSAEAKEWARKNVHPLGERDFPVDHPKAADTPGNLNHLPVTAGVDPLNPHREAFTGRTPAQVAGIRKLSEIASQAAKESPMVQPIDAAVVNRMLDQKRSQVGRDMLTPEEYQSVLRDYHATRAEGVAAATEDLKLTVEQQAISYVMSRGYTVDVASTIVRIEGAAKMLKSAGITPS
jgi:hypothetical protein